MNALEWIVCAIVASSARRSTHRWPPVGTLERGQLGRDLMTLEWWVSNPNFEPAWMREIHCN